MCFSSSKDNVTHSNASFIDVFEKLKIQIREQEFSNIEEVKCSIDSIEKSFHNNAKKLIINKLYTIINAIRPLNIHQLIVSLKEVKKMSQTVKEKEIVLLIGETGSGKSTTIQWLSGARLKRTKVEVEKAGYLEHYEMVDEGQVDLSKVKTSPFMKSETRFVLPISIPLENGELIVCDLPGLEDTAGTEVDIANCFGINEAIRECKSVRLLVFLSYPSIGDRGQGIQKAAKMLSKMIPDIEDRLQAVSYVLTKFPEKTCFSAMLENMCKNIDRQNEADDVTFKAVLDDMKQKSYHVFSVHPENDNRLDLIKIISSLRPIKEPNDVFRLSLTENSHAILRTQLNRDNFNVLNGIKRKDYISASYYLNNINQLNSILKDSSSLETYRTAELQVEKEIDKLKQETLKSFSKAISIREKLSEEYLYEFERNLKHLKISGKWIKSIEKFYPEALNSIVLEMEKRFDQVSKEINFDSLGFYLENLKLLKTIMEDEKASVSKLFDKAVTFCKESLLETTIKTKEYINTYQYNLADESLKEAIKGFLVLEPIMKDIIPSSLTELPLFIDKHLTDIVERGSVAISEIPQIVLHAQSDRIQEIIEKFKECVDKCSAASKTSIPRQIIQLLSMNSERSHTNELKNETRSS